MVLSGIIKKGWHSAGWARVALAGSWCGLYQQIAWRHFGLSPSEETDQIEDIFFSMGGTPPMLLVLITAWLLWNRRDALRPSKVRSSPLGITLVGAAGILIALGLRAWSAYVAAPQVLPLSLAVLIVSSALILGGGRSARALSFPALFVALLGTPIPPPILNDLFYPMQLFTASAATAIVQTLGYPALQSADLIVTPWALFKVIESCAGLRSSLTLMMGAFVYCELMQVPGRRRAVLIAAAPLIGILVNIGRVVFLVFLPVPEDQPGHTLQGIVMIVMGVLLLWGLEEALRRAALRCRAEETGPLKTTAKNEKESAGPRPAPVRIWLLAALFALAAVGADALPQYWIDRPDRSATPHAIPRQVGEWHTGQKTLIPDTRYLGSTRFSNLTWREYRSGEALVTLLAGDNDRIRRYTHLVSEKTMTLTAGTRLIETHPLPRNQAERALSLVAFQGEHLYAEHWYENTESLMVETLRSALALDRGPGRRTQPSRVFQISTPVGTAPGDLERAKARVADFRRALQALRDEQGLLGTPMR